MANYHLSAKAISRSQGRSATGAAAYRASERIADERTGIVHDYTRKGGTVHAEIVLPDGAPGRFADRSELWNAAELAEKRKDSQVAREVEVSLPRELPREEQIELARSFARGQFAERGMCADVCIHDRGDGNPHAHILLTTRECAGDGFGGKRRDWNDKALLLEWRESWEREQNGRLERRYEREGTPQRERSFVDCRSLQERGIDRLPQQHEGPNVKAIEDREMRRCRDAGTAYEPATAARRENMRRERINRALERMRARAAELARSMREASERIRAQAAERFAERRSGRTAVREMVRDLERADTLADHISMLREDYDRVGHEAGSDSGARIAEIDEKLEDSRSNAFYGLERHLGSLEESIARDERNLEELKRHRLANRHRISWASDSLAYDKRIHEKVRAERDALVSEKEELLARDRERAERIARGREPIEREMEAARRQLSDMIDGLDERYRALDGRQRAEVAREAQNWGSVTHERIRGGYERELREQERLREEELARERAIASRTPGGIYLDDRGNDWLYDELHDMCRDIYGFADAVLDRGAGERLCSVDLRDLRERIGKLEIDDFDHDDLKRILKSVRSIGDRLGDGQRPERNSRDIGRRERPDGNVEALLRQREADRGRDYGHERGRGGR